MRPIAVPALAAVAALSGCLTLKPGTDTADLGVGDDGPMGGADMMADLANGPDMNCWNPSGFGGRGCYSCKPTTRDQLLNSCNTSSQCISFDTPLPLGDGGLPHWPERDMVLGPDMVAIPDLTSNADMAQAAADMAGPQLPSCASLPGVVYVTGSSAVGPFLGFIAQALENVNPPKTVAYQSSGSCLGVSAIVTPLASKMTGTATWWDSNLGIDPNSAQAKLTCKLDPGGVQADVGLSDVFATTCLDLPGGLDPSIKDTFGPVEIMTMAVPQNSSQRSISAAAAYLVWGFGGSAFPVPPWTDPNYLFQRNANSGTQAQIAKTLNLPREVWHGKTNAGSGNVRDALITAGAGGQATAMASFPSAPCASPAMPTAATSAPSRRPSRAAATSRSAPPASSLRPAAPPAAAIRIVRWASPATCSPDRCAGIASRSRVERPGARRREQLGIERPDLTRHACPAEARLGGLPRASPDGHAAARVVEERADAGGERGR